MMDEISKIKGNHRFINNKKQQGKTNNKSKHTHSEPSWILLYHKNHFSALELETRQIQNLYVIQFLSDFHHKHMSNYVGQMILRRSLAY